MKPSRMLLTLASVVALVLPLASATAFAGPQDDAARAARCLASDRVAASDGQLGQPADHDRLSERCPAWEVRHQDPDAAGWDIGGPSVLSLDGATLYMTGGSWVDSPARMNIVTVAVDAVTGDLRWQARYESPSPSGALPAAIAVSPDGRTVYVAGSTRLTPTDAPAVEASVSDFLLAAYDAATGTPRYTTRTDLSVGSRADVATGMVLSPDGLTAYLTGYSELASSPGGGGQYVAATVAYDTATGVVAWITRSDLARAPWKGTIPDAVAVSPSGDRVYVAARTSMYTSDREVGSGQQDAVLLALDSSTGAEAWQHAFTSIDLVEQPAPSLAVAPDGRVVLSLWVIEPRTAWVAGVVGVNETTGRWETFVFRPDGTSPWSAVLPGAMNPSALAVDAGGDVYVAGLDASGMDGLVVRYDRGSGAVRWQRAYDLGARDRPHDLSVGADGTVLVGGIATETVETWVECTPFGTGLPDGCVDAGAESLTALALSPVGRLLWSGRVDGGSPDPNIGLFRTRASIHDAAGRAVLTGSLGEAGRVRDTSAFPLVTAFPEARNRHEFVVAGFGTGF